MSKTHDADPIVCPRCGRVELFIDGIGEELCPDATR
jgi:hypothetical protein